MSAPQQLAGDSVLRPIETPNLEILDRFETAAGTEIDNARVLTPLSDAEVAFLKGKYRREYPSAVSKNLKASPTYNCHGRVFASGRTGIDKSSTVRAILVDDGYRQVSKDEALAGDVVLYVDAKREVEHSAILVCPARESITRFDKVVSKWGYFFEYLHEVFACPYEYSEVEYWRLDPGEKDLA